MSGEQLTFTNLNKVLLREFPMLEAQFGYKIGGISGWEPGQYVVFGSVFSSYIEEATYQDETARSKIAEFVERMAMASDDGIIELLKIEVIPVYLKKQQILDAYWPTLGSHTRNLVSLLAPRLAPELRCPPCCPPQ